MNNLGLPAVPRSASSSSLYHRSGHSTPVPPTSASRSDTPVAFPRVASSSTSHAGVAGASSYAPSHLPQDHHHHHHLPSRESPRLPYSSVPPQPLTASTSSSNTHPHAHLHHSHGYNSTYDARLVANTINRIEATSGIGAPGSTIEGLGGSGASGSPALGSGGSLGSSNANTSGGGIGGTASTSSTNLAGQAPDADGWTAVCIRTLPLLYVSLGNPFARLPSSPAGATTLTNVRLDCIPATGKVREATSRTSTISSLCTSGRLSTSWDPTLRS